MPAPETIGPYVIVELLGQGGMGAVYRARHRDVPVDRALKAMPAGRIDQKRLQRFEREGRNLARVVHENVVRVHDAGSDRGRPYLVMDLVEGRGLDKVLEGERLPLARALELGLGIVRGVAALHEAGIVHRDLKPENVLVREDGVPVVVDLGLALAPDLDDRLTRSGAVMGTPLTMSPEQCMAQPVGPPADVWSLGLILFHLLTGKAATPPADNMPMLMHALTHQDRPRLGSVDPDLPSALEDLVARMLAREASARPADARVALDSLEELADALRAGKLGGTAGASRRRRRLVRGAAALAGLGVVGALVSAGLAATSPPPTAPGPATVTTERAPVVPAGPSLEDGATELRALQRAPDSSKRFAEVEAWLERWPTHPERPAAQKLSSELRARLPLRSLDAPGLVGHVEWVDDQRIIGASPDGTFTWDLASGERRLVSKDIGAVAVAGAGGRVVQCGTGSIRVYDRALKRVLPDDPSLLEGVVPQCLVTTPDGALALAGDVRDTAHVFVPGGRELVKLGPHGQDVRAVALTPDGALAVTGSGAGDGQGVEPDNSVRIWRLPAGTLERRVLVYGRVTTLALRPGSDEVLVGTNNGRLYALSLTKDEPPVALSGEGIPPDGDLMGALPAHVGGIRDVAVSPDGALAWSGSGGSSRERNELRCWDLVARRERYHVVGDKGVRAVAVSPDGKRVAVTRDDGPLEVWLAP